MAIQEKTFAQVLVASTTAATPTTIYTATTGDILKFVRPTNVSTTLDTTVKIWFVKSGEAANLDKNVLYPNLTIPLNDFATEHCYIPMTTGDKITAIASVANKANILLTGASIT